MLYTIYYRDNNKNHHSVITDTVQETQATIIADGGYIEAITRTR